MLVLMVQIEEDFPTRTRRVAFLNAFEMFEVSRTYISYCIILLPVSNDVAHERDHVQRASHGFPVRDGGREEMSLRYIQSHGNELTLAIKRPVSR